MHCAGAVMQAALERSRALASECAVAAQLVAYWTQHIIDESGHDRWLLEDLHHLGLNADLVAATIPPPEIAELLGTLHFWIEHTHPVAALAYFFVVERSPPTLPYVEQLVAMGIPRPALRTFHRHAVIDVEHGRELEELVDTLPLTATHRELFQLSAVTVVRQLTRIMEGHLRRADEMAAT